MQALFYLRKRQWSYKWTQFLKHMDLLTIIVVFFISVIFLDTAYTAWKSLLLPHGLKEKLLQIDTGIFLFALSVFLYTLSTGSYRSPVDFSAFYADTTILLTTPISQGSVLRLKFLYAYCLRALILAVIFFILYPLMQQLYGFSVKQTFNLLLLSILLLITHLNLQWIIFNCKPCRRYFRLVGDALLLFYFVLFVYYSFFRVGFPALLNIDIKYGDLWPGATFFAWICAVISTGYVWSGLRDCDLSRLLYQSELMARLKKAFQVKDFAEMKIVGDKIKTEKRQPAWTIPFYGPGKYAIIWKSMLITFRQPLTYWLLVSITSLVFIKNFSSVTGENLFLTAGIVVSLGYFLAQQLQISLHHDMHHVNIFVQLPLKEADVTQTHNFLPVFFLVIMSIVSMVIIFINSSISFCSWFFITVAIILTCYLVSITSFVSYLAIKNVQIDSIVKRSIVIIGLNVLYLIYPEAIVAFFYVGLTVSVPLWLNLALICLMVLVLSLCLTKKAHILLKKVCA